jgi:putative membrane protein
MHRIHSMALAAGLVMAVGVATSAQTPPPQPQQPKPTPQTMPRDKASMPDKPPMANPDAEFAHKAAMGGKHEVDGAKFAANKAQNADLKALANRLIQDHTAANTELSTIMKTKKIAMGEAKMGEPKSEPGNESWRSLSGAAFDRAYADHLVTEHEKTITLFETEASSGTDAELKAFATKTLPTLKEHLKAAQDLKAKLGTT